MNKIARLLAAAAIASTACAALAQNSTPAEKKAPPPVDNSDKIVHGTMTYDAESIKDLYREYKEQNEKKAENLPLGLRVEEDTVYLKTIQVEADRIREERALREKLDPNPRRRLERLAEIDPDAANDLLVTMRNDEEFMSGARDPRPAGGTGGGLNQKQLSEAVARVRAAIGKDKEEEEAR